MSAIPDFSSPKRAQNMPPNWEGTPTSPPFRDVSMYPWNWGEGAHEISLSPASSCGSPEAVGDRTRRGRPRAENISNLIVKGSTTESDIRCKICNRVFPREKSLQAHMRTHTGERPYICDYPSCGRAFCQSGQLKTHQRLHTGEKPFICSVEGCQSRFTHANRHCSKHPTVSLKRVELSAPTTPRAIRTEHDLAVQLWLNKQAKLKEERTPKRQRINRALVADIENQACPQQSPTALPEEEQESPPAKIEPCPRKRLAVDDQETMGSSSVCKRATGEKQGSALLERLTAVSPNIMGMPATILGIQPIINTTNPVLQGHNPVNINPAPSNIRIVQPHQNVAGIPSLNDIVVPAVQPCVGPPQRPITSIALNRHMLGIELLSAEESAELGVNKLDLAPAHTPLVTAPTVQDKVKHIGEERDKIMGALALVELALGK